MRCYLDNDICYSYDGGSLEALEEVAKGDANKVFIPFEATSALSSLGAMKEIVTDKKDTKNLASNTAIDAKKLMV